MKRRTFLASTGTAVGASLAGCVGENDVPGDGDGTTTDDGDGTTTDDGNGTTTDDGDGTTTDDGDVGEIVATETIPVSAGSTRPDWYGSPGDPAGALTAIDSRERARAVLPHADLPEDRQEAIREFLQETTFDDSLLLYAESAGPDLCHRRIDVEGIALDDRTVTGTARVVDTSDEGEACAEALVYPTALVRVEFEGTPATAAAMTVVDGWGNEETTTASAGDPISPDPDDLPGYVRPEGDPPAVPEPLVCEEAGVERVQNWVEEDRIEYGHATDDEGTPTLALRVEEAEYEVGETVSIAMTNVTDRFQHTGNRHKYSIEVRTEDGWQDLRVRPEDRPLEYTDEAIGHRPGDGFRWSLELTEEGLVEGHFHEDRVEVCPGLPEGRYRFVFWEPAVAVAFDVT